MSEQAKHRSTPREAVDRAVERIEEARATAESGIEEGLLVDPYDLHVIDTGSDPLTVQQDRAKRSEQGQTERHRRRRLNAQRRDE